MTNDFSRHIKLEFIGNLRDLGGYLTHAGRKIAWRKLFRSGVPDHKNADDVAVLKQETGIASILDLRGSNECSREKVDLLTRNGIRYRSIPLLVDAVGPGYEDDTDLFTRISSLGEFYLLTMINQEGFAARLTEALEFVADPKNQPVLFHCALGKDRTGILSAAILDILGVPHEEIINDYHLTDSYMPEFLEQLTQTPDGLKFVETFPAYMWKAQKESMQTVLSEIIDNHGSFRDYLVNSGCDPSLFTRLEEAFLDGNE